MKNNETKKPQLGQRLVALLYSKGAAGAAVMTALTFVALHRPKVPKGAGE